MQTGQQHFPYPAEAIRQAYTEPLPLDDAAGLRSASMVYRMSAALEHLESALGDVVRVAMPNAGDYPKDLVSRDEVRSFLYIVFTEATESGLDNPMRERLDDLAEQLATATHALAHVLVAAAQCQDFALRAAGRKVSQGAEVGGGALMPAD